MRDQQNPSELIFISYFSDEGKYPVLASRKKWPRPNGVSNKELATAKSVLGEERIMDSTKLTKENIIRGGAILLTRARKNSEGGLAKYFASKYPDKKIKISTPK